MASSDGRKNICPSCRSLVARGTDVCPVCGLGGLNQVFLSREDREAWLDEVAAPHREAYERGRLPQVFACGDSGLILSGDGRLYGIGANDCGQLGDDLPAYVKLPQQIAGNVTSAALGKCYAIYVTGDGEVHLLGNGKYRDIFKGFSGARRVYADPDYDVFGIVDMENRLFLFGENRGYFDKDRRRLAVYEDTRLRSGWINPSNGMWTMNGDYMSAGSVENQIMASREYREYANRYGAYNLDIVVSWGDSVQAPGGGSYWYGSERMDMIKKIHYTAEIYVENNILSVPRLYRDEPGDEVPRLVPFWRQWNSGNDQHLKGGKQPENLKKIQIAPEGLLYLYKDGTLVCGFEGMDLYTFPEKIADVSLAAQETGYYRQDRCLFLCVTEKGEILGGRLAAFEIPSVNVRTPGDLSEMVRKLRKGYEEWEKSLRIIKLP